MAHLILASSSPRRRELLAMLGARFDVRSPEADESYDPSLPPEEIVKTISEKKALAARASSGPEDTIVAADTMVFSDGLRLGKPRSGDEARAMLSSLSGRTHRVCTGLTVCRGDRAETRAETTLVTFRDLTDAEIDAYIATGEPMDKAGAYGVQGRAALFVERIEGDFFNVMGLPLCLLGRVLREFGVEL